jgi:hypothetical protein
VYRRRRRIEVGDQDASDLRRAALTLAYQRACASFEDITEFRAKLLTVLPLATGTGAFLLQRSADRAPLGPLGLLGFAVTVGLFAYELRGMQRCTRLEVQAATLEDQLGLSREEGPFKGQPKRSLGGMLGPPAAGLIIYLGSAFTWLYVAGLGFSSYLNSPRAWRLLVVYVAVLTYANVLVAVGVLVWWWLDRAATGKQTKPDRHPIIWF